MSRGVASSIQRRGIRCAGLTLVEVLMALAIVSLALLAWVRLDGALARAERSAEVRRELAAWMRNELRLQRNVRALACLGPAPADGWSCSVERICLDDLSPCASESIRVTITPPVGAPLEGRTAVWWPLQQARVVGGGR